MTTVMGLPDPAKALEYFLGFMEFTTGPIELDHWISDRADINIIDVREAEDYARGHIPGATNLPREKWNTFAGLSTNKVNVVYCYTQTCHLAPEACVRFASHGYPVKEMKGGLAAWRAAGLKIEGTPLSERHRKAA